MAFFIECSKQYDTWKSTEYGNTTAVNIDNCNGITKLNKIMDIGEDQKPIILFDFNNGTLAWVFDTEAERDAEFRRIIFLSGGS